MGVLEEPCLFVDYKRQREGEKRKKRKGKPSVPFCWTYDRQSGHQTVVRRNCNGWKLYILAVDIYCKRCVQRNKLGQPEKKTLQTIRTVATKTSRNYVTRRNEMPQVVLSFVISIEWQNSCVITWSTFSIFFVITSFSNKRFYLFPKFKWRSSSRVWKCGDGHAGRRPGKSEGFISRHHSAS